MPKVKEGRKQVRVVQINGITFTVVYKPDNRPRYTVVGPFMHPGVQFVEFYDAVEGAWVDVICAHLNVAGNRGLIDKRTANWPYDVIAENLIDPEMT